MMEVTFVINGTVKLVLTPSNDEEKSLLKKLQGGSCSLVTDNVNILNKSISGALIIEAGQVKTDKQ
jgi:hypothetical protein